MEGFMAILGINTLCQDLSPVLRFMGQILNIFKLFLPLILISLGIIDIGRAVISSKTEDIKKNLKKFGKKIIACVVVFFIPMICMVIFGFVSGFNDIKENSGIDFEVCYNCMFDPNNSKCTDAYKIAEGEVED